MPIGSKDSDGSTAASNPSDKSFFEFLKDFIGQLASDDFSTDGNLCNYLQKDQALRGGDEAQIVDIRITKVMLFALGYSDKEVDYNLASSHLRPDFAVKISEYPRPACFIVEDKNTTELSLHKHRPQLQGYMTQRGAGRGLLINGHAIVAYDQIEGGIHTPAIEVPLSSVVRAWRGEHVLAAGKREISGLEEAGLIGIVAALWRRFRRSSFASLQGLIDDLTLQSDKGGNAPHKVNGETWTPSRSRIPIIRLDETNAELLTEAIKGLISEFEDDADAQLAAIEADYQVFTEAASKIPNEKSTLADQEEVILSDLVQLMSSSDPENRESDVAVVRKILRNELGYAELNSIQRRLYQLNKTEEKKGKDKDSIAMLILRIKAFAEKRHRYRAKLSALHGDSIKVSEYFRDWKEKTASLVFQSENESKLRREFLSQTAYLIIIRLLIVRIMEDKKLVNRMFTNGGIALWFRDVEPHYLEHAMGRSADFLLDLAYTSAQHIYSHFFAERSVLDWYAPDRNAVVRVLHKLAGFDLRNIDRDIIGSVYNQYVEAKHKHESGMYFTPPSVVAFMLDRIGYKGSEIIGKKLIDLSCGSGGFLVEAAKRLVLAHTEYWKSQGYPAVPPREVQGVLESVRHSLHGVDLNPFACSLAETNLLIQVIDLFAIALEAKEAATIDRFHIYNSDSLIFSADTLASKAGTLPFPETDLPIEDQVKGGLGLWASRYDFVVGNPPYVRADENEFLQAYRVRVKKEHPVESVRSSMVQKWDLFVPFVAASCELLKARDEHAEPGAMAIITSKGIETVPYASALRGQLAHGTCVKEIHFFPGVKLFEDAVVENTIIIVSNDTPTKASHTKRYWHSEPPRRGAMLRAKVQNLKQLEYGQDIFRQELPSIKIAVGVPSRPLDKVFYISKGMVMHANENTNKGAFTLDDLLTDLPAKGHDTPFAGSKDIDFFGIKNVRYIEYGTGTRVPEKISRPTFPELYDRPKFMAAEFGGFSYDDGRWDPGGFLKCNHSVFVLMPWHHIAKIQNKSISSEIKGRESERAIYESDSSKINPWYALAFLNSMQMRLLLDGVNRSAIRGRLQPDDLRNISIPIASSSIQDVASKLAEQASEIQRCLLPYRRERWQISESEVTAPAKIPAGIPKLSFDQARVKWSLTIKHGSARVEKLVRNGNKLFAGKQEAVSFPSAVPELATEWLRRQFLEYPEGTSLAQIEANLNVEIPDNPAAAVKALELITKQEDEVRSQIRMLVVLKEKISETLEPLFDRIKHPDVKEH